MSQKMFLSVILSIYMHWNKDQILLIYSPTFTVTQALGLVLTKQNVMKRKRGEKGNSHLASNFTHTTKSYIVLDGACPDAAKWN